MKTQPKIKKIKKQINRRRAGPVPPQFMVLVHAKRAGLRHFRLVEHQHTGRIIHYRHTSHLALIMILIFIGYILLTSDSVVQAQTDSGQVTVNAIVPDSGQVTVSTITPDNRQAIINETQTSNIAFVDDIIANITWFMSPVPLYITAFALTLGFWIGDLFHYRFGISRYHRRAH